MPNDIAMTDDPEFRETFDESTADPHDYCLTDESLRSYKYNGHDVLGVSTVFKTRNGQHYILSKEGFDKFTESAGERLPSTFANDEDGRAHWLTHIAPAIREVEDSSAPAIREVEEYSLVTDDVSSRSPSSYRLVRPIDASRATMLTDRNLFHPALAYSAEGSTSMMPIPPTGFEDYRQYTFDFDRRVLNELPVEARQAENHQGRWTADWKRGESGVLEMVIPNRLCLSIAPDTSPMEMTMEESTAMGITNSVCHNYEEHRIVDGATFPLTLLERVLLVEHVARTCQNNQSTDATSLLETTTSDKKSWYDKEAVIENVDGILSDFASSYRLSASRGDTNLNSGETEFQRDVGDGNQLLLTFFDPPPSVQLLKDEMEKRWAENIAAAEEELGKRDAMSWADRFANEPPSPNFRVSGAERDHSPSTRDALMRFPRGSPSISRSPQVQALEIDITGIDFSSL